MTREEIRIQKIKKKLNVLGPMLPGSLRKQWNVCGTPGCKCKDRTSPVKHGPYWQLSFTVGGRSSTMFIKKEDIPEVRRRMRNYERFKDLSIELLQAYVALARKKEFGGKSS